MVIAYTASVNRAIWSPDGSFMGTLIAIYFHSSFYFHTDSIYEERFCTSTRNITYNCVPNNVLVVGSRIPEILEAYGEPADSFFFRSFLLFSPSPLLFQVLHIPSI